MKNVVSIGLYLFFTSLHFHKIEIYPTKAELKEGSNHGFYLRHLHHLYCICINTSKIPLAGLTRRERELSTYCRCWRAVL